ncbi:hypothetical protein E2C01_097565 [Portunus trituberculatus]|uniref:Uncharacterized protein n=1 Tax=Portunus trituberculatus TaxID=210409 RepID=A0A5B7JYY6_PORTR|nr:hypothetical protein [Portunus trituberculatus]
MYSITCKESNTFNSLRMQENLNSYQPCEIDGVKSRENLEGAARYQAVHKKTAWEEKEGGRDRGIEERCVDVIA